MTETQDPTASQTNLLQGTLDLLILKALALGQCVYVCTLFQGTAKCGSVKHGKWEMIALVGRNQPEDNGRDPGGVKCTLLSWKKAFISVPSWRGR